MTMTAGKAASVAGRQRKPCTMSPPLGYDTVRHAGDDGAMAIVATSVAVSAGFILALLREGRVGHLTQEFSCGRPGPRPAQARPRKEPTRRATGQPCERDI